MRIHRIRLRNYRGVEESEVRFPTQGVTIVEGDNEAGKTSLSEALDLLLAERDDSSKHRVRAVKPVHRDAGAEVEVEMTTGPYHFIYRKRWHRQKETVLEIIEPQRAQLTGREAHDKVCAILEETLDESLWDAFRLKQGAQLEQAAFAGGSLGRALDLAAGGDTAGDLEDDLWERVTAEHQRYWTATGQMKGERVTLAKKVAEASARVDALEGSLRSLDDDATAVERLCAETKVLSDTQHFQEADEAALVARFEAIQSERNNVSRLEGLRETAVAQRDHALGLRTVRADLIRRAAESTAVAAEIEARVAAALPARREVVAELSVLQQRFDSMKVEVVRLEADARQAIADRDFLRQEIEVAQLSERLERATDALGRRHQAEAILEASRVDDGLVERIEELGIEVAKAEAAVAIGAASVTVDVPTDLQVEIDGGGVCVVAGTTHQFTVDGPTEVCVPGVVSIVVNPGTEARALTDRLAAARASFQSACDLGGVSDLAEARRAASLRDEAARTLVHTAKSIEDDLRDLTLDALAQKAASLTAKVARYRDERPSAPPLPRDHDAADIRAFETEAALQQYRQELDHVEKNLTNVKADVQAHELDGASDKARLEQARIAESQEQRSLADARALTGDEALDNQVLETEAVLSTRLVELSAAQDQLAAQDPDTVEELLRNARGVRARLTDELYDKEVRIRELRTKLSLLGEDGLASQLDNAKSALAHLAASHERLEARSAAAKLLYETLAHRRTEAHHRYVAPFREGIEALGRLVFGPTLEVDLADNLSIARRTLDGVTLDFADLSTGAKEQLGMISRLACASIVAAEGGAPVIFDDALGWSDPRKLERMGAAISKAGRSCQIIVLTCTPGRYASVGDASVVQLAS